MLKEKIKKN